MDELTAIRMQITITLREGGRGWGPVLSQDEIQIDAPVAAAKALAGAAGKPVSEALLAAVAAAPSNWAEYHAEQAALEAERAAREAAANGTD